MWLPVVLPLVIFMLFCHFFFNLLGLFVADCFPGLLDVSSHLNKKVKGREDERCVCSFETRLQREHIFIILTIPRGSECCEWASPWTERREVERCRASEWSERRELTNIASDRVKTRLSVTINAPCVVHRFVCLSVHQSFYFFNYTILSFVSILATEQTHIK